MSSAEEIPDAALQACPDPVRIRSIVREVYGWLAADGDNKPTAAQKQEWGWDAAYSLRTWPDFPGISIDIPKVIMQRASCGLLALGGPRKDSAYLKEAKQTREMWRTASKKFK